MNFHRYRCVWIQTPNGHEIFEMIIDQLYNYLIEV